MEQKKTKEKIISDAVCGLIMLVCVLAYFIVAFITGGWHPYWIIPACGGVVCGVVSLIFNTVAGIKEVNKQDSDKEQK